MADAVFVEMARPADARDVLEALGACGLTAELVQVDGSWEIEIVSSEEEAGHAVAEVSHALDAWVAECGIPFIPMRVGERRLAVRPPGD
jgi:hypothetical protein